MTKENSTKPAFVSMESGRDGFLTATRVGIIRTPTMSCCHCFDQWNTAARWTEHTGKLQPWSERMLIKYRNKLCSEWCPVFMHIMFHSFKFLLEWIYSFTHFKSTLIPCKSPQEFFPSVNFQWLTPAYVYSPVSDLTLLLPFVPRTWWWGRSLVCFLVTTCVPREPFGCDLCPQSEPTREDTKWGKNISYYARVLFSPLFLMHCFKQAHELTKKHT